MEVLEIPNIGTGWWATWSVCENWIWELPEECDDWWFTGYNDGCTSLCLFATGQIKCLDGTLPLNSVKNTASEIPWLCSSAISTGCLIWTPSQIYSYNLSWSIHYCYFKCDTWYVWDWSNCN